VVHFHIKVIWDSRIPTRWTIFYELLLLLGYVDDLDMISRTAVDLKEAFLSLIEVAEDMGR